MGSKGKKPSRPGKSLSTSAKKLGKEHDSRVKGVSRDTSTAIDNSKIEKYYFEELDVGTEKDNSLLRDLLVPNEGPLTDTHRRYLGTAARDFDDHILCQQSQLTTQQQADLRGKHQWLEEQGFIINEYRTAAYSTPAYRKMENLRATSSSCDANDSFECWLSTAHRHEQLWNIVDSNRQAGSRKGRQ